MSKTARGCCVPLAGASASGDPATAHCFHHGIRPSAPCRRPSLLSWRVASATDAQSLNQRPVARLIVLLDVVKQRPPLRDHLQNAAPRVVVLNMRLEMFG